MLQPIAQMDESMNGTSGLAGIWALKGHVTFVLMGQGRVEALQAARTMVVQGMGTWPVGPTDVRGQRRLY